MEDNMKRIFFLFVCVMFLSTYAFGQFVVNQDKSEILDWYGRNFNMPAQPGWMLDMLAGNGVAYCQTFGLTGSVNRKFIVPGGARELGLENARAVADVDTVGYVGQEMATAINATMGNSLNDDQKSVVRNICLRTKVDVSGVRREGEFWQKIRTTESNGRVRTEYHAWSFYSMSQATYNTLLEAYLTKLFESNDLDGQAKSVIAQKAQEIIDDENKRTQARDERRREELKAQLEFEEQKTRRIEAQERTAQVESNNKRRQVEAQERTAQVQSANDAKSGGIVDTAASATMSPALATLVKQFL